MTTEPAPRPEGERDAGDRPPGAPRPAAESSGAGGGLLPRDAHLLVGLGLPLVLLAVCLWRLREHTVDDAYISFRYARNLAGGLGLVFNVGERIEGYTSFLFTCLLAAGIKLGVAPTVGSKVLGAASALGSLGCTYAISARLARPRAVPVLATWLLAGSVPTAAYAVVGLETSFFVFLLLLATWLFLREIERPRAFPWSGVALALAALTRPEGPMFALLLLLFLGGAPPSGANAAPAFPAAGAAGSGARAFLRGLAERRSLLRAALFLVPALVHLGFRRAYYGAWLPNTLHAKTGDLQQQLTSGLAYVIDYAAHAGPFVFLVAGGVWLAIAQRRRDLGALATIAAAQLAYVIVIGGDWMPQHRLLVPFEPFCFLLVDVAVRELAEARSRATRVGLAAFAIYTAWARGRAFSEGARVIDDERQFWTSAAGGVANWFEQHGSRGTLAVADMGFIAYATDYPILDLLGLVDPVISRLPGGYTQKTGPGYLERVFEVRPRYFVLVGGREDCFTLPFPSQQVLLRDPRFQLRYELAAQVRHSKAGVWCIFASRDARDPRVP